MPAEDRRADAVPLERAGLAVVAGEDHDAVGLAGDDRTDVCGVLLPPDRLGLVVVEVRVEGVRERLHREDRHQRGPGDHRGGGESGAREDEGPAGPLLGQPRAARGEQRDDRPGQVVALAAGHQEHRGHDQEDERRQPGRAPGVAPQELDQADDPQHAEERAEHRERLADHAQPAAEAAVLLGDVGGQLERRPVVAPLPDEVGHPEQHGVDSRRSRATGSRSARRECRSSASATRMPSSRNATACLLLRPIPATTPATSHSLGRSSTSAWVTRTRTAVQASVSKVAVDSRWPTVMTTALAATVTAVSTWADRAPPSSRANCTASSTSPATARMLQRRSTTRLCSASSVESRASSGVNDGWSG